MDDGMSFVLKMVGFIVLGQVLFIGYAYFGMPAELSRSFFFGGLFKKEKKMSFKKKFLIGLFFTLLFCAYSLLVRWI